MRSSTVDIRVSRTSRGISRRLAVAAAALLAVAAARSARAGFTEAVPSSTEAQQAPILSHALGGTFTAEGNNFTNGTITATQLDDNDAQIWSAPIVSAQAVAAFSSDPEVFGYIAGTGQGNFTPLFTTSGHGYDVTGSSGLVAQSGSYQLSRSGGSTSTFSSDPANNPDQGAVHLLAYSITGLPDQAPNTQTWMLFWEDTVAQYSDWDYNDLVVKLETDPTNADITPPPLLIPLPPAAWSGLSGLAVLLVVGGIARRRRQPA